MPSPADYCTYKLFMHINVLNYVEFIDLIIIIVIVIIIDNNRINIKE